jgi:CheY-like chemotaxis protein
VQPASPIGRTVLVVEDEAQEREELTAVLRHAGYTVRTAADGHAALECLLDNPPPCVVLLDMFLPGLDGWDFLKVYQRDPALAGIPVVILSSLDVGSLAWAASLGAAGYLRKPVDRIALLDAVRRAASPP